MHGGSVKCTEGATGRGKIPAMGRLAAAVLLPLLPGFAACSPGVESPSFYLRIDGEVRSRVGDDGAFKDPAYDDAGWSRSPFWKLPREPKIRWVRSHFSLPRELPPGEPLAVAVSALASHELYWDGVLIGRGGRVGATAGEEVPGSLWQVHAVPRELLKPGDHVVALRTSAWHVGFEATTSSYVLRVGDLRNLETAALRQALVPLLTLGALVLAGLYFLVLSLLERDPLPHLLLGLLSLTTAAQLVIEVWRSLEPYAYDLHVVRLRWIAALAWLAGGLLVGFLAARFRALRGGLLTAGSLALSALAAWLSPGYDAKTSFAFLVALLFALGLSATALIRGQPGAGFASAGVATCLLLMFLTPGLFLDLTLFYAISLLLLFLLFAHARQIRRERRDHEAALVNAMRLELELVKKHLSPHFLMNTLNTLSELFEQQPEVAGVALEALAEELRGLQEIASERLIPMARELALCRAHLVLMGLRRDRRFRLETEGVEEGSMVPPAIFHTLLENALTHNRYGPEEVAFRIRQAREGRRRRYVFEAPAGEEGAAERGSGTGLQYLRARLREAFGDDWELVSQGNGRRWRTEIVMPAGGLA